MLEKRCVSKEEAEAGLSGLEKLALLTPAELAIEAVEKDPSDNMFLSAAAEGRADYIISGDHHLTGLGFFRGIPIVTPSRFFEVFRAAP
ncbi:conserved hypothetical protein [uncultured Desulfatiglans sp.]|nr:conserved hypothetical protein [uncultured Desulfatiglans sp.]